MEKPVKVDRLFCFAPGIDDNLYQFIIKMSPDSSDSYRNRDEILMFRIVNADWKIY